MTTTIINRQRLTIRAGRGTLAFCVSVSDGQAILFEPYVVKSGVSMAANLREAFKTADLLQQLPRRVRVLVDSDVLMMPVEQFDENTCEAMYRHAFPGKESDGVFFDVLPDLNSVALFSLSKDMRLVIDDHFQDVSIMAALSPLWRHLHRRSYTGSHQKLYGYFHERRMEVCCFQKNRFKFCNSFDATQPHDALYYLLYVWKQLQLERDADELHLVGDIPGEQWLTGELHRYLRKVYVINAAADFNNHPVTEIKGMPYDLMTLHAQGR